MSLCFVDPADAIRAIADSVGREARRQLLGEAVRAWVDEIPDDELEAHYAKAISELDEHDLSMLAAWHGSMEVGHPVPNRDFLMGAFGSLGENRREALKLAAGFRGEEAVDAGVTEEDALETRPRLALAAAPDGARGRGRRALRLGPRRLRQLADGGSASAASISAIACSLSRKWTALMPASRRRRMLTSTSSTNRHASAGRRRSAPGSARRSRDSGLRQPTKPESTTVSKISSTGSIARQSGSHSRTLLVSIAIR